MSHSPSILSSKTAPLRLGPTAEVCPHCRNVFEHRVKRGKREYCPMCGAELEVKQ